jgi:chloramphenicol 3-O phosphotransferase
MHCNITPGRPGSIVFLNGTSSSGKTTILKALQNILAEPFLDAGIDKFIWMMPERYLERPLWDDVLGKADHAGQTGLSLVDAMHKTIETLSLAGWNVISDHVLVENAWREDCIRRFSALPAYLIGIRCPLGELERREKARKNRTLGQARLQYEVVHTGLKYDLEVDTSILSAEECAEKIKSWLVSHPPEALRNMRQDREIPQKFNFSPAQSG